MKQILLFFFSIFIFASERLSHPFIQLGHSNNVTSVSVCDNVLISSDWKSIKITDMKSNKLLKHIGFGASIVACDKEQFYAYSDMGDDTIISIWDAKSMVLTNEIRIHNSSFNPFATGGKYLAVGLNKYIKIWTKDGSHYYSFDNPFYDERSFVAKNSLEALLVNNNYLVAAFSSKGLNAKGKILCWSMRSKKLLWSVQLQSNFIKDMKLIDENIFVATYDYIEVRNIVSGKKNRTINAPKNHSTKQIHIKGDMLYVASHYTLDKYSIINNKYLESYLDISGSLKIDHIKCIDSTDSEIVLGMSYPKGIVTFNESKNRVQDIYNVGIPVNSIDLMGDDLYAGYKNYTIGRWSLTRGICNTIIKLNEKQIPKYGKGLFNIGIKENLIVSRFSLKNEFSIWKNKNLFKTISNKTDINSSMTGILKIYEDKVYFSGLGIYSLKDNKNIVNFFNNGGDNTFSSIAIDNNYFVAAGPRNLIKVWLIGKRDPIAIFGHSKHGLGINDIAVTGNYIVSSTNKEYNIWSLKGKHIKEKKFTEIEYNNHAIVNLFSEEDTLERLINGIVSGYKLTKNRILKINSSNGSIKVWNRNSREFLVDLYKMGDNNWLTITPEGYFTGSQGATQHLNITKYTKNGMEPFDFSQLYDHFFRPDLVKLKLSGDEEAYQKAIAGMTYEEALKNPPPKLAFKTIESKEVKISGFEYEAVETNNDKVKLTFNIKQHDGGGIGLIRIYQEGKLIKTIGEGKVNKQSANVDTVMEQEKLDVKQKKAQTIKIASLEKEFQDKIIKSIDTNLSVEDTIATVKQDTTTNAEGNYTIELELIAGNNDISIEAFNKTNTVTSYRENITIHADIPKQKPKLYAIVAGVNEFETPSVNNLKYSQNDAKAIKEVAENKMSTLFDDVEVTYLTGKEVTKANILKAAQSIRKKAKLTDTILFYISTHGRAARGKLYLVPQNNKLVKDWIDFEETFQAIQSIKALNQIFIIDACESGKANDIVSAVYDSRASVLAKSSGVHMLLATTKGTSAFEHPDKNIKNGVFTYRILQTLKDKSTDLNKDKTISILELSKKLKEPQDNTDYQYPVIRNVGKDVGLEKLK